MKSVHLIGVVGLAVAGMLIAGHRLSGEQQSPELLAEVRALRIAIEQLAVNGTRAQVLLGRVQLEEQRISEAARRLASVREQMAGLQRNSAMMAGAIKEVEDRYTSATTPEERTDAERELARLRLQGQQVAQSARELAGEESTLAAELAAEQARWSEFNQRLEDLERVLTVR